MKEENLKNSHMENFLSYNIHVGSAEKNLNFATKAYLQEIVDNCCVFESSHTYVSLNRVRQYIYYLHEREKKILFIGTPRSLKKEFSDLCEKYNHYSIETWFYGLFTNFSRAYQNKRKTLLHVKERPSLIFLFDLTKYEEAKEEAKRLEIPIMAFINSDDKIESVDYKIYSNVKSGKGGLFVLNFFSEVLKEAQVAQVIHKKNLEIEKKRDEQRKKRKIMLKLKQKKMRIEALRELWRKKGKVKRKKKRYNPNWQKRESKKKDYFPKDNSSPFKEKKSYSSSNSKTQKPSHFESNRVKKN